TSRTSPLPAAGRPIDRVGTLSTLSICQSTKPVAARENRPASAGDTNLTRAIFIWLACSEPNQGSARASFTDLRVVTTHTIGSTAMSDSRQPLLANIAGGDPAQPPTNNPAIKITR